MTSSIWLMTQGTDNVSVRVQSLSTSSSPLDVQVTVSPGQAVPFYISSLFEQPLGNVVTNDGVRITASSPIFADVYLRATTHHGDHGGGGGGGGGVMVVMWGFMSSDVGLTY